MAGAGQVQDGQPPMSQSDAGLGVNPYSSVVGPPVDQVRAMAPAVSESLSLFSG